MVVVDGQHRCGVPEHSLLPQSGQCQASAGAVTHGVVVTDQCASYHWLDPTRHQFCLAHVQRNLQEMADYGGGGQTAYLGHRLVVLFKTVFRTQHRYESGLIGEQVWLRRMQRLRRSIQVVLGRVPRFRRDVTPVAASIFSSMKPGCGCSCSIRGRR